MEYLKSMNNTFQTIIILTPIIAITIVMFMAVLNSKNVDISDE